MAMSDQHPGQIVDKATVLEQPLPVSIAFKHALRCSRIIEACAHQGAGPENGSSTKGRQQALPARRERWPSDRRSG